MPIDLYSTRAQLAAISLMPPEHSFLSDVFCADMGVVEDDKAIYDYRKGVKQMAPFVVPGTGGVLLGRDGYETREIGFCTIAPERVVENDQLKGRAFGEDILGAMTPEQREKKMIAQDLTDMRKAIQRRREWMARQVLLTGRLDIFRYTSEGREVKTTQVADYGFTQNYTPATPWNQAGADIVSDMHQITDLVYDGLGVLDVIVMAPDVAASLVNNDKYVKLLDSRNVDVGELNLKYRGQGVRYIGHNVDGVEMYSLSGKFLDDDGQYKPMMPSGTLIAGGRGMLKMVHGPVTQVEEAGPGARHKTYIKKEVPLRYGSIDGNAVMNRLTSCPTVVPFNVDAWVVASVL